MTNIITTILAGMLVGLITGKAVVRTVSHLIAWVITKLSEKGFFDIFMSEGPSNYEAFYMAHAGDLDIEH